MPNAIQMHPYDERAREILRTFYPERIQILELPWDIKSRRNICVLANSVQRLQPEGARREVSRVI